MEGSPINNVLLVASVASLAAPIVPETHPSQSQESSMTITEAAHRIALLNADAFNDHPSSPSSNNPLLENQHVNNLHSIHHNSSMMMRDQRSASAPFHSSGISHHESVPGAASFPFVNSSVETNALSGLPPNAYAIDRSSNNIDDRSISALTETIGGVFNGAFPLASGSDATSFPNVDITAVNSHKQADAHESGSHIYNVSSSFVGELADLNATTAQIPVHDANPLSFSTEAATPVGIPKLSRNILFTPSLPNNSVGQLNHAASFLEPSPKSP